jgi:hypothetical protein
MAIFLWCRLADAIGAQELTKIKLPSTLRYSRRCDLIFLGGCKKVHNPSRNEPLNTASRRSILDVVILLKFKSLSSAAAIAALTTAWTLFPVDVAHSAVDEYSAKSAITDYNTPATTAKPLTSDNNGLPERRVYGFPQAVEDSKHTANVRGVDASSVAKKTEAMWITSRDMVRWTVQGAVTYVIGLILAYLMRKRIARLIKRTSGWFGGGSPVPSIAPDQDNTPPDGAKNDNTPSDDTKSA